MGEELGRRLAEVGAVVVTGGYAGLMSAVSRGAHAAGGHVVGLPMSAWTHLTPNVWITELRWASDYPSRLAAILETDCVIALDGGVGTLSELAVVWAAAQTEPDMPLIVALGPHWARAIEALGRELVVGEDDLALVRLASSPAEAVELVLSGRTPGGDSPIARG